MRKILILTLILSSSYSAKAQETGWVDEGATWHYNFWNLFVQGYYEYNYTYDTLIEGHTCQVIEGERHMYAESPELELLSVSSLPTQYVYMSGDTLFYRDHDAFFVMLNFNAEVGDTWIISTTNTGFEMCDDTSRVELLEIGTITIDGVVYETITVAPTASSSVGFVGTFVKRFGNITAGLSPFLSPFPMGFECEAMEGEIAVEWDWLGFSCFQDNSFSLYQPYSEYCAYYSGVAENSLPTIQLYPNPANEYIMIENANGTNYEIFDITGKTVQAGKLTDQRIDVLGLSEGTYVLKIEEVVARFVIRQ